MLCLTDCFRASLFLWLRVLLFATPLVYYVGCAFVRSFALFSKVFVWLFV